MTKDDGVDVRAGYALRDWVYVAVFGALWGAAEMTAGAYLHVLFPPMADTFLVGLTMAGLGAIIVMVGRQFVSRGGAVLSMGIIAALLKALSLGGMKLGPMVAIFAEALLVEIVFLPTEPALHHHYILAGSLAVSWNFFHKFVMMRILFGKGIEEVYEKMIVDGGSVLGLDVNQAVMIIVALFLVRVAVGAVAGQLAWVLGGAVKRRLAGDA